MVRSALLFAVLAWLVQATDASCVANAWALKARCALIGKQAYDSADECMADGGVFEPYDSDDPDGCGCCSPSSGGDAAAVPTPRPTAPSEPSDAGAPTPRPTTPPTRAPSSAGPVPTNTVVTHDTFPTSAPVPAPYGGSDGDEFDPAGAAPDSDGDGADDVGFEFTNDDAAADAGTVAWLLCPYLLLALAGVLFIHMRMRRRRRAGGMGLDGAFRGGGGGMFGGRTFGWGRGRAGPVYDVHLPLGVEMVEA